MNENAVAWNEICASQYFILGGLIRYYFIIPVSQVNGIDSFIKIYLYRITYSVVQYTLSYNMVLLRLVKHKPQLIHNSLLFLLAIKTVQYISNFTVHRWNHCVLMFCLNCVKIDVSSCNSRHHSYDYPCASEVTLVNDDNTILIITGTLFINMV